MLVFLNPRAQGSFSQVFLSPDTACSCVSHCLGRGRERAHGLALFLLATSPLHAGHLYPEHKLGWKSYWC